MRTTLNISMPPLQKKNVDRMIKDYNYASVSEFFRDAVRALEEDKTVNHWKNSYENLVENIKFLSSNKSIDFLKKEPNLYENY